MRYRNLIAGVAAMLLAATPAFAQLLNPPAKPNSPLLGYALDVPRPPETEYAIALADVKNIKAVPEHERRCIRYITFCGLPPQDRAGAQATAKWAVKQVSWSTNREPPEPVPGTNGRVWRINVLDCVRNEKDLKQWLETWELLTLADPFMLEPWVNSEEADELQELTGSVGAILRADFFYYWALLDDNPKTKDVIEGFYNHFLGLPDDEASLFELLGVDFQQVVEFGSDRKGAVTISGRGSDGPPVSRNNRFIYRAPTALKPHGAYLYYTQDYFNSRANRNVLNDPLNDDKDGGEYIWSMPNGTQGYYLTQKTLVDGQPKIVNGKPFFERIHEGPQGVVFDAHFYKGPVRMNSCTVCHPHGINLFRDALTESVLPIKGQKGIVNLTEAKPFQIQRTEQLYQADFKAVVLADRMAYDFAVREITGLEPEAFVAVYTKAISDYDKPVDATRAVWEFGIVDSDLQNYLGDKVVSTTRGPLLDLLGDGAVPRDSFEEEYKNGRLLQEIKQSIVRKDGESIILQVPATVEGLAVEVPVVEDVRWWVGDEGRTYGPVDGVQLDEWFQQKRIKSTSYLMRADKPDQKWFPAHQVFPDKFKQ